jgi:2-polyprenyl-3-methyl-5-hydroxy-6-metoxy-1,4-benzoquinol methylase
MSDPVRHPRTDRGEREFDITSLKQTTYGRYVSRDYAAHWFRWQHAKRFIKPGMRVLDIGCGEDQMMTKVLRQSQSFVPELYVGVDVRRLARKSQIAWTRIIDEFDVTRRWKELLTKNDVMTGQYLGPFDLICCFEVIEHMPVERGMALFKALKALVKPDGIILLSTPVYNGKHMAANHIHEYGFDELAAEIKRSGLIIDRVVGTFMTSQAIKRVATPAQRALVEELHAKWYAWDILANFLAPLYPEASSNCCWLLRKE